MILYFIIFVGMLLSLYLLYAHFVPEGNRLCTFGQMFNCDIANKSPYANLDGISYLLTIEFNLPLPLITIADTHPILDFLTTNSFLGFLTLLIILTLVRRRYYSRDFMFIEYQKIQSWLRGITLFSVLYGVYLIFVQHYILKTYCIFCLALDLVLFSVFLLVWSDKD